jgi:hypothetical protein
MTITSDLLQRHFQTLVEDDRNSCLAKKAPASVGMRAL